MWQLLQDLRWIAPISACRMYCYYAPPNLQQKRAYQKKLNGDKYDVCPAGTVTTA